LPEANAYRIDFAGAICGERPQPTARRNIISIRATKVP
jgi:hypothetical protein